ncbi:MAG: Sec-independent protein translocase protein TatB [Hyphomicrobiaceae bacterium]
MFNLDWTELLIIAVIAVLVVGPKELPGMLRTIGQYVGKMRKVAGEFRNQFDQAMKEAELDGVQQAIKDTKAVVNQVNPVHELKKAVLEADTTVKEISKTVDEKPGVNGATASATPAVGATVTPPPPPTSEEKRTVAQRAADAWKKAAGDESGA